MPIDIVPVNVPKCIRCQLVSQIQLSIITAQENSYKLCIWSVIIWELPQLIEVDWSRNPLRAEHSEQEKSLNIVKAWVGKMPCALDVSTETIAHVTMCHVIVVSCTHGTVIFLHLTVQK